MKIEIINIRKWLDLNKLSLNVAKTQFLVFDTLEDSDCIKIEIGDETIGIDECKVVKYLGLFLDNKLSFSSHIEHIKKKVVKRIGAMYRCKNRS